MGGVSHSYGAPALAGKAESFRGGGLKFRKEEVIHTNSSKGVPCVDEEGGKEGGEGGVGGRGGGAYSMSFLCVCLYVSFFFFSFPFTSISSFFLACHIYIFLGVNS